MSDTSTTSTGMTGAGGGSMIRITGMASGLDVDALVKKMMTAEQTKLDKAKQAQQTIQWKQDAYQSIIKDIKDLQSSFFDVSSSDKNILSSTNFSPFTVSAANGASTVDTSVATFTPGIGVQNGTYKVHVKNLATGAGVSNALTGKTLSTSLSSLDATSSLNTSIQLTLNVGGDDINVKLDNTKGSATIGDLVDAINNQAGASVKASFSELTGEFKLNTSDTGASTKLTIGSGSTSALSEILGNVIGTTANNGENADVTVTVPGGNSVHFTDNPGSETGTQAGKSSNTFTIDGMTYNLSSDGNGAGADASVNVGTDTQKVYDKVKGFIDKYNTIVDEIQTKLTEKKDSSYPPLTDSQRSSMSDTQIKAWEDKAKVGILRNDLNLQTMLNSLRSAFTSAVSNTGISLGRYSDNNIGIDTSTDYTTPGHIDLFDESKLKTAIASKPDQILRMFTNVSTSADTSKTYDSSNTRYNEDGIFTRIKSIFETNVGYTNTTFNNGTLTIYANKQYDYSSTGTSGQGTLPDQIYEQQLMVKKITSEMSDKQEKYYQQFSQLETAMETLNTQQSQLSSMLGG